MTSSEALKIIESLANGVDPETGKPLRQRSPVSTPRVIRALFIATRALQAASESELKVAPQSPRSMAGKPWSEEEEKRMLAAFDAGIPLAKIAADHARKIGGIESRLVRLGRISLSKSVDNVD